MNRGYRITSFFITAIVAIFVFVLAALFACNPTYFADDKLFSYDRTDGILVLFGEDLPLSPEVADFILDYPKNALDFCGRFVWGGVDLN